MTVQRFLPQAARSARFAHLRWILFFCPAFGAAAYMSRHIPPVAVIFSVLCVGSLALRVRGLRRPSTVLEVDLDRRTITLVRPASRGNPEPLDSWAPLIVSQAEHALSQSDSKATVYVVNSPTHPEIALFVTGTPGAARAKMERLAREWKIPFGGQLHEQSPPAERDPDDRVHLARLILSEVKLHDAKLLAGLSQDLALMDKLRTRLQRAYRMYLDRTEATAEAEKLFREAAVRILADGNTLLLEPALTEVFQQARDQTARSS